MAALRSGMALALAVTALPVIFQQAPCFAAKKEAMSGAGSFTADASSWQNYMRAGDTALDVGNYQGAQNTFNLALRTMTPPDKESETEMKAGLCEALMWQGLIDQAAQELNKALSLSKGLAANSAARGRVLDDMAWLSQAQGNSARAETYCRQALEQRQLALGQNSPAVAESLEHLGSILDEKNMFMESALLYQKAIKIRQATAGDNSLTAANDMEKMAAAFVRMGKGQEALPAFGTALAIKESDGDVFQRYAPHPWEETVTYSFLPGAPNCDRNMNAGHVAERVTASGITVEAAMVSKPSEFVKTARAYVRISNNTDRPVTILEKPAMMVIVRPKVKLARLMSGEEVASAVEKSGEKKAKWVLFWGKDATTPLTTTVIGAQGRFPYGYGYVPPAFGYVGPGYNWSSWNCGSGMTTITTNVPDYAARQRAYEKADQITNRSATDADAARRTALGPGTVPPRTVVEGTLDFDEPKFEKGILRVPVGNATFEFSFDQAK